MTKMKQKGDNATELDAGNKDNGKYKIETIFNNTIYIKKSKSGYLPGFYN